MYFHPVRRGYRAEFDDPVMASKPSTSPAGMLDVRYIGASEQCLDLTDVDTIFVIEKGTTAVLKHRRIYTIDKDANYRDKSVASLYCHSA